MISQYKNSPAKTKEFGSVWSKGAVGTVIAKEEDRTRRVDKGKSGQALKTAVSGGFGGGILSQDLKQASHSFGGTELRL